MGEEHAVGRCEFDRESDEGEAEVEDAVGAELAGGAEVEGFADGCEEAGGGFFAEVVGEGFVLVLGVGGYAVAGEEAGHDLCGPFFDLPPRPGVSFFGGEGLVSGLESGVCFRELFCEYGLEYIEPGLHGLWVGE